MSTKTIWEIDPLHSQIQFKVRHLVISNVTGKFNKFSATMETDGDDVSTAKINFEVRSVKSEKFLWINSRYCGSCFTS